MGVPSLTLSDTLTLLNYSDVILIIKGFQLPLCLLGAFLLLQLAPWKLVSIFTI